MGIQIFLGDPPAGIKQWIIAHAQPAGHADTIFTFNGGQTVSKNISGTLDESIWTWDGGYEILVYEGSEKLLKSDLVSVDIGNTVESIGYQVFTRCTGLTSVTIPNSVTSIDVQAFYCSGLTNVTIPNSMTSIGDLVFQSCESLTSVTIPNSVESIGEEAFRGCSSLMNVTIPDSVTSIGTWAFYSCKNLTSVSIDKTKEQVISMGYQNWGLGIELDEEMWEETIFQVTIHCTGDNQDIILYPES